MARTKARPFTIHANVNQYKRWLYPGGKLRVPVVAYVLVIIAQALIIARRWHSDPVNASAVLLLVSITIIGIIILINSPRQSVTLTDTHMVHKGPLMTSRYAFTGVQEIIFAQSYRQKKSSSAYARIFIVRRFRRRTSLQQVFINSAYFKPQDIKRLAAELASRSNAKLKTYGSLDTDRLAKVDVRALSVIEGSTAALVAGLLVGTTGLYLLILVVLVYTR